MSAQAYTHGRRWGAAGAGCYFVAADTGRVLFLLRSRFVNEPNTWGIPGGAVDAGEDPREAAVRECGEELGDFPDPLGVSDLPDYVGTDDGWVFKNFAVLVPHEFTPALDWENQGHGWFAPEQIPRLDLHPGIRELFNAHA